MTEQKGRETPETAELQPEDPAAAEEQRTEQLADADASAARDLAAPSAQSSEDEESAESEDDGVELPVVPARRARITLWAVAALAVIVAAFSAGWAFGGGDSETADPHAGHTDSNTIWTCAMHPQIRSNEPGQCPICGMELIPLVEQGDAPAPDEVVLTPRAQVLSRIGTTPVTRLADARTEVRMLGRADYDETRIRTVTAWTAGRIDRLQVRTTGESLRKGQTIASLYSPELHAAHRDLLVSLRQVDRLRDATPSARSGAEATLRAARERLRLLGVSSSQLAQMETAKSPWRDVPIRTPFAGTVIERLVAEGQYVKAGEPLFKTVDLGGLWVQLDAYEQDLSKLSPGQSVELQFTTFPGETFDGTVAFVDPVVNARTRTTRVRVAVENEDGRLRPGMFAEAVVAGGDESSPLVIPRSAPLFSGRRSLVYVEVPDRERPTYQAREVKLGPRLGGLFPVVAGLRHGERVVTYGAFTLDADLQIRGGMSLMTRGDDTEPTQYDGVVKTPAPHRKTIASMLDSLLGVQEALAADDLAVAKVAAGDVAAAAAAFEPVEDAGFVAAWAPIRRNVVASAKSLSTATDLVSARAQLGPLTDAGRALLETLGHTGDGDIVLAFCPMAYGGKGAFWIQRDGPLANPYYGKAMLNCGEKRQTIAPSGYLAQGAELRSAPASTSSTQAAPSSQPTTTGGAE